MGMRAIYWSEVARDCRCSTSHFFNWRRRGQGVAIRV